MIKVLLAAVAVVFAVSTARAEPTPIKVGWVVYTSSSVPLMLEYKSLLKHFGRSYTVEPQNIRSTAATIAALASGELHVSTLSYSTIAFAMQEGGLDDLRIISDVLQDGVGGHASGQFVVRNDSDIKRVEDLKGRILASLAKGSAVDIGLRAMLRKHGLDDDKDVTIIEAQFRNMRALLLDKRVELIATAPPYSEDAALKANAHALFSTRDVMGVTQTLVWVARDPWLKKNRAAVVDFLEDSLTVTRHATDPKNHAEVVGIVAKAIKAPPEQLASYLYTPKDLYRDPSGLPNLQALESNIALQHRLGFIKDKPEVRKATDLSYVKEAGARLGMAK
jgi:NitT/TauT family transport system substrate-binding protein